MTSGFSSSDVEVLKRDNENNLDDVVATSLDQIEEAYDIQRCINFIQVSQSYKYQKEFRSKGCI